MTWRFSSTTRISSRPLREVARAVRLPAARHADLVQADADVGGRLLVEAEVGQRLARVVVGLAGGDDAEAACGLSRSLWLSLLART